MAFAIIEQISSPTGLLTAKGGLKSLVGGIMTTYSDLTAANANPYIKDYAGALIVTADNTVYYRNQAANAWLTFLTTANFGFDADDLAPLFTTTVTNPTTTSYLLSFTLTPQTQGTVFGNDAQGSPGLPVFTSNPTLGRANTTEGTLTFYSSTSGSTVIRLVGGAGNWNFNLPLGAGGIGQVLTSQGGGSNAMTWTTVLTGITADNGLTANTTTNVQLGGTLLKITNIITNGFTLRIVTNSGGVNPLYVQCTGGANATESHALGSGDGLYVSSQTGRAIFAASGATLCAEFWANFSSDNNIETVLKINRFTNGSAIDGIGGSIDLYVERTGVEALTNKLITEWLLTDTTTRQTQFSITGVDSTGEKTLIALRGDGRTTFNEYGVGTFAGSAAYLLGVDASGNVVETSPAGGGEAGVYTPSLSAVANIAAVTGATEWQYLSVTDAVTGIKVVTVSGYVNISITSGGILTQLDIDLPLVAASFTAINQCGGTAYSLNVAGQGGGIKARVGTDLVRLEFISVDNINTDMFLSFTYQSLPA